MAKRKKVGKRAGARKRSGFRASAAVKQTKRKGSKGAHKQVQRRRNDKATRNRKMAPARKAVPRKLKRADKARSKPAKSKRSDRAKRQSRSRDKIRALEGQLKREQERTRGLTKVVKDLTQSSRQVIRTNEDTGEEYEFNPPPGAIVRRDGDSITIELPDYLSEEWADIEWDYDYEDLLDEVGEEEADLYGEDGG